jgi:hypothetical protein
MYRLSILDLKVKKILYRLQEWRIISIGMNHISTQYGPTLIDSRTSLYGGPNFSWFPLWLHFKSSLSGNTFRNTVLWQRVSAKVSPQWHAGTGWGLVVYLHSFLTSAIDWVGGQRHDPAAFPRERAPGSTYTGGGWVPGAGLEKKKTTSCLTKVITPNGPVRSEPLYPIR